jgi:predicted O-methyltransferase YrrM
VWRASRALRRDAAEVETIGAAMRLAETFSVAGFSIDPIQVESEFARLLALIESERPRAVLEIGTAKGGTLFLFTRVAADDAILVTIDLDGQPFPAISPRALLCRTFARSEQCVVPLFGSDSHDPQTRALGGRRLDFLFIDGDHSAEGVRADFDLYTPLVRSGGLVALHDIVPGNDEQVGGVPAFWQSLKERFETEDFVESYAQGAYGIGVLRVP